MNRLLRPLIAVLLCISLTITPLTGLSALAGSIGNQGMISISAGDDYYLSLKGDGTVWAWGNNNYGQLGDGTDMRRDVPVQVQGLSGISFVSAGVDHSLAVGKDGSVWAWGSNRLAELGAYNLRESDIPIKVEQMSDAIAVAAGTFHSLALKKDGTVWGWGHYLRTPAQVPGLDQVIAISATRFDSLALKKDGTVWTWSMERNSSADGSDAFTPPVQITGLSDVIAISTAEHHSLALKKDGTVWAWGRNYAGQLGDGTTEDRKVPVQVQQLEDIISVSAGTTFSLALKKDGTVWAWGNNAYGELGVKVEYINLGSGKRTIEIFDTPIQVGIADVLAISGGETRSFAVKKDGTVWGWGEGLIGISSIDAAQQYTIDAKLISYWAFSEGLVFNGSSFIDRYGKYDIGVPYGSFVLCSDAYVFKEGLAKTCLFGESDETLYGFMDRRGHEVVKPQYTSAENFSEGLAVVKRQGKYGYIDHTGKEVIPLRYEDALSFSEGLAAVELNGKYGYIDQTGRVVIEHQYSDAQRFREGLALVSKDGKLKLIDKSGKELQLLSNENMEYRSVSSGLIQFINYNDYRYGYMDKSGKIVIAPKYMQLGGFYEGLAHFTDHDRKVGFVNRNGNEVIPAKYDTVRNFSEGLAAVSKGGKWGFIDNTGKEVISIQFEQAMSFNEGVAAVQVNGRWGYISNPLDVLADWAKPEVELATSLHLVPDFMKYGYGNNITRADFSRLVVLFLMNAQSKPIEEILYEHGKKIDPDAFTDTKDYAILAANALGIVQGKGERFFDMNGEITRQEAAVMLARMAALFGASPSQMGGDFADAGEIAPWAKEAVAFVSSLEDRTNGAKVMGGTGNNKFEPHANFTKQQSLVTMKRLYYAIGRFDTPGGLAVHNPGNAAGHASDDVPGVTTTGYINIQFITSANSALGYRWADDIQLTFVNDKGLEINVTVDYNDTILWGLYNGKHSVKAESKNAYVNLQSEILEVVSGQTTLNIEITPKYTLVIDKGGEYYNFSFINVEEIAGNIYSGNKTRIFAVSPGLSFMIKDHDSGKIYTIPIGSGLAATTVRLD